MQRIAWIIFFVLFTIFQNFSLKAGSIRECESPDQQSWALYKKVAIVGTDRLRHFLIVNGYLRWCNIEKTKVYGQEPLSNLDLNTTKMVIKTVVKKGKKVEQLTLKLKKISRGRINKKLVLYSCPESKCSKNLGDLSSYILSMALKASSTRIVAYSQKTQTESSNYSLPQKNSVTFSAEDIIKSENLDLINTWKKVYVAAQKDFNPNPTSQSFQDRKYMLFAEEFFSAKLKELIGKYKKFYKSQTWHKGYKPQIPLSNNEEALSFVKKIDRKKQTKFAIMGDLHSSFHSLLHFIFDLDSKGFFQKILGQSSLKLKPNYEIIFLGDMVDRGPYGLEIIFLISLLKSMNFDQVHVIKGNHEEPKTYNRYGLLEEITYQFPKTQGKYPLLEEFFNYFPSALYLKVEEIKFQFSHGVFNYRYAGASQQGYFTSKESSPLLKFLQSSQNFAYLGHDFLNHESALEEYRWSDASQKRVGDERRFNDITGRSYYSADFIEDYLNRHNILAIVRGHQDATNLGLIRPTRLSKNTHDFKLNGDKKFNIDHQKNRYRGIMWIPNESYKTIELIPRHDFTVVTTSSATYAKKLPQTTYLILSF